MKIDWQQQTIIITGAYGGLGKALCEKLTELGADLIITGRNLDKLNNLKFNLPDKTKVLTGDISSDKFKRELFQIANHAHSSGHILINNAGLSDVQFLESQSDEVIQQMLEVNLLTPILLSKTMLPWLKQAESAKVINIGSTFGAIGYPGFSVYGATKFGLRGFSQALNRELKDTNISVHYLAPRAMKTSINSEKVNQLNIKLKNKVDTVEDIVLQIIQAIEKNNTEKHFGFPEKLFAKINGLFPKVVSDSINKQHKIIKNIINKQT